MGVGGAGEGGRAQPQRISRLSLPPSLPLPPEGVGGDEDFFDPDLERYRQVLAQRKREKEAGGGGGQNEELRAKTDKLEKENTEYERELAEMRQELAVAQEELSAAKKVWGGGSGWG